MLVSDGRNTGKPNFQGFSLSLYAKDGAEADKLFNALAEGGEVRMPMDKTFFSPRFGMLADKFGVGWMVHRARSERGAPAIYRGEALMAATAKRAKTSSCRACSTRRARCCGNASPIRNA